MSGQEDPSKPIAAASRGSNVLPFPKPPKLERALGQVRLGFTRRDDVTALAELFQSGCAKVRFPLPEPASAREAVLLNTAGGLTDGDRLRSDIAWGPGTQAVVTTQAAERVYRSREAPARIETWLTVGAEALAVWLPQETILFEAANLRRRTLVKVDPAGRLLACESLIFGRAAMGEDMRSGDIRDTWRVRFGERLVFADDFLLAGDPAAALDRPAVAGGARALAAVLYVGEDAPGLLAAVRESDPPAAGRAEAQVACSCRAPVLLVRIVAQGGLALRRALNDAVTALMRGLAASGAPPALPRVWTH